jgi:hypothetical protein
MNRTLNRSAQDESASRSRRTDRPMMSPRRPPAIQPTRVAAAGEDQDPHAYTIGLPTTSPLPADVPPIVLRIPEIASTVAFTEQLIAASPPKEKKTRAAVLSVVILLVLLGGMLLMRGGKKPQSTPLLPEPASPPWQSTKTLSQTPLPLWQEPAGPPVQEPAVTEAAPAIPRYPNTGVPADANVANQYREERMATRPANFAPRYSNEMPVEASPPVTILPMEKLEQRSNYVSP